MPGTSFLMRSISRPRLSGLQHESPSVGREGGREGGRERGREGGRGGREGGRGGRLYLRGCCRWLGCVCLALYKNS